MFFKYLCLISFLLQTGSAPDPPPTFEEFSKGFESSGGSYIDTAIADCVDVLKQVQNGEMDDFLSSWVNRKKPEASSTFKRCQEGACPRGSLTVDKCLIIVSEYGSSLETELFPLDQAIKLKEATTEDDKTEIALHSRDSMDKENQRRVGTVMGFIQMIFEKLKGENPTLDFLEFVAVCSKVRKTKSMFRFGPFKQGARDSRYEKLVNDPVISAIIHAIKTCVFELKSVANTNGPLFQEAPGLMSQEGAPEVEVPMA
ncbi:hypothetical protein RF11_13485 [Thelohanellus kitauei]|uniref:Uncharacterized protein n=1 Tax=Thelohanellus kitauei TaxID=669202 RepID=A0A0C2J1F5_THEKT|nr:hypothetical protein RF11_13485 [Thelohanellus kitauei]